MCHDSLPLPTQDEMQGWLGLYRRHVKSYMLWQSAQNIHYVA